MIICIQLNLRNVNLKKADAYVKGFTITVAIAWFRQYCLGWEKQVLYLLNPEQKLTVNIAVTMSSDKVCSRYSSEMWSPYHTSMDIATERSTIAHSQKHC